MTPVEKVSRVLVGVDFDDASASALKMAGVLFTWWSKRVRRVMLWYEWPPTSI